MQAPKPWIQLTLRPPIKLQTPICGNIDLCPYFGATQTAKITEDIIATDPHDRKPGERNSFLNSAIFVTLCSSGALRARMEAPRIHWIDPIQPKRDSFSFRMMWDRIADITTDNAPMGVYVEVRFLFYSIEMQETNAQPRWLPRMRKPRSYIFPLDGCERTAIPPSCAKNAPRIIMVIPVHHITFGSTISAGQRRRSITHRFEIIKTLPSHLPLL